MEIIMYVIIFLIGIYFGSFFTLAVYRIPKAENITYKHSYCPKCNHKLGMLDLVPVFSYLFLGAKCRYCKEKIRPRYFLLEILSGISFVLFALSLNINFTNIEINKIVYFIFGILYFSALVIIAGIDKEKHTIQKSVLLYGLLICTVYIIYSCTINYNNVYAYVIYLVITGILIILDNYFLKRKLKESYLIELLILLVIMTIFSTEYIIIYTIILSLLSIGVDILLNKIVNHKPTVRINRKKIQVPFAFYICISNIVIIIVTNFMYYFYILGK